MATCPVCRKMFKSEFGLVGHLRLKQDPAHIQYNNRILGNVMNEPVQNDTTIALQKQVMTLTNEIQTLKEQPVQTPAQSPVQQQPIEKSKTEDLTIKDVEEIVQHAPKQQPVTAVEQALHEEKQKIADLKAEKELLELLKSQMDGSVHHDHDIMDNAPESLYQELKNHHIYHDWDT